MFDPSVFTSYAFGILAAFIGFATLTNFSNGVELKPLSLFWVGLSVLWLWFHAEYFYGSGILPRLIVFAFSFHCASPVLGYIWWGKHRRIRKKFLRIVLFTFLWGFGFMGCAILLGPENVALSSLGGLVFAIIGIIP